MAQGSGTPFVHSVCAPVLQASRLTAAWSVELNEAVASLFSQAPAQAFLPGKFFGPHIYYTYSETFQAELEGKNNFVAYTERTATM